MARRDGLRCASFSAVRVIRKMARAASLGIGLLALQGLQAQSSPWTVNPHLPVEDLGTPIRFTGEQGRIVFQSSGSGDLHLLTLYLPYVGIPGADHPFQIHDLNLTKNRAVIVPGIVGRPAPCGFLFHSNGKVYIGTARPCALLEYDPESQTARDLGVLSDNYYHGVQTFTEGKDGNIYYGTYGRSIGRHNFKTGTNENFGIVGGADQVGWGYVFSIGSDGDYVYCGIGKAPYYLCVYDIKKKTTRDFFKPEGAPSTKDYYVRKGKDGNFYYPRDNAHYPLRNGQPATNETGAVAYEIPPGVRPDGAAARFGIDIDLGLANPSSFNNGDVTIRFKKTNETEWTVSSLTGMPIYPCAIKRLMKRSDGQILGTTPFVGPAFILDRTTNAAAYLGMLPGSIYDMIESGGKIYFAGYVNAFAQYDPAQPWSLTASHDAKPGNPKSIPLLFGGKHNYFLAAGRDGRIYAAGHHERDSLGGSLAWYDPGSGASGGIREEMRKHDVTDLCSLNGGELIVVSTFAVDGAATGRLFVYDAVAHRLAATWDPFPDRSNAGHLFPAGPDHVMGLIPLAETGTDQVKRESGLVYKMNVKTGKVLFQKRVDGKCFSGASAGEFLYYDARFELGPDGCGWLFVDNWLSRIHPEDGTVEPIREMKRKGRLLFVEQDLYIYNGGRVFFGGFSQVLRIRNAVLPVQQAKGLEAGLTRPSGSSL